MTQYERNVIWVNKQIRICVMAKRLLKSEKPRQYQWLLNNCNHNWRQDLLPLKELMAEDQETYRLRFLSYNRGLLLDVFDLEHWKSQAIILRTIKPK